MTNEERKAIEELRRKTEEKRKHAIEEQAQLTAAELQQLKIMQERLAEKVRNKMLQNSTPTEEYKPYYF